MPIRERDGAAFRRIPPRQCLGPRTSDNLHAHRFELGVQRCAELCGKAGEQGRIAGDKRYCFFWMCVGDFTGQFRSHGPCSDDKNAACLSYGPVPARIVLAQGVNVADSRFDGYEV